jgi:hypothetical protein
MVEFDDPIVIVHPDRWEDWEDQELDVFLNKEIRDTQVIIAERTQWIQLLLGETDG